MVSMITDIAYVGYPVKDVKKARGFYEGILGLVPSDEFGPTTNESQFIEYNIGHSTISIGNMEGWDPSENGATAALETDNFVELIAKLKENNVAFKMEPIEFPSCHLAIVRDPEGNQVTLHQKIVK